MDSIIIKGGTPLYGNIKISGAKNAALPIIAASLLSQREIILRNVPKLADIQTISELLLSFGSLINTSKDETNNCYTLNINNSRITSFIADYNIVRKMRASIWVLAPLLARFGEVKVSLPGGCQIGPRQVDLHIKVLEQMGASISIENGYIVAFTKKGLKGCNFNFEKISVGATITAIMAATLAEGETILNNCALEPEISDLCSFLTSIGAKIENIGNSTIKVIGVTTLNNGEYEIMPDRIEAGTYMVAAAITKGELVVEGIDYHLVENIAQKLKETGVVIENNLQGIKVKGEVKINSVDIDTAPYPGFATDLQAQFMALMTLAAGRSIISENIFENRFMHVPELCRMGADIKIENHQAIVNGVSSLKGAEVMASDLRASVSLILAGLAAEGTTKVRRIYHLDRGYQDLVGKLRKCGAIIERVITSDS